MIGKAFPQPFIGAHWAKRCDIFRYPFLRSSSLPVYGSSFSCLSVIIIAQRWRDDFRIKIRFKIVLSVVVLDRSNP